MSLWMTKKGKTPKISRYGIHLDFMGYFGYI